MKLITVPLTQVALKLLDLDVCPENKIEQLNLSEDEYCNP